MTIFSDPIAIIYENKILNEDYTGDREDFRPVEKDDSGYYDPQLIVKKPGIHATFVEDVAFEDGNLRDVLVEYIAEYESEDAENTENFGKYQHSAGGWVITPFKFSISTAAARLEVTNYVSKEGLQKTVEYLESLF